MNNHGEETKPVTITRRKAVKTIVGGVTAVAAYNILPATWNTPIIESIFIPAHAATSGTSLSDPCEVTWVSGYQDSSTVTVDITGYVTPPTANLPTTIVATGNPDSDATTTLTTTTAADGTFSGTATLTTASGIGTVLVTTSVEGASGSASCRVDIPQRWEETEETESSCCDSDGGADGYINFNFKSGVPFSMNLTYWKCGESQPTSVERPSGIVTMNNVDISQVIVISDAPVSSIDALNNTSASQVEDYEWNIQIGSCGSFAAQVNLDGF